MSEKAILALEGGSADRGLIEVLNQMVSEMHAATTAANTAISELKIHVAECTGIQKSAESARTQLLQRITEFQETQRRTEEVHQMDRLGVERKFRKQRKKIERVERARVAREAHRDKMLARYAVGLLVSIVGFYGAEVFIQVFHVAH